MVQRFYVSPLSSLRKDGVHPGLRAGGAPGEDRWGEHHVAPYLGAEWSSQLRVSATRPRRLVRLLTTASCGAPPSSIINLRKRPRSSSSMSTDSHATARGLSPRRTAWALIF